MNYHTFEPGEELSFFVKCPEMGYFGMFIDTEGNKLAVHSME